jgi:hypothetical protein
MKNSPPNKRSKIQRTPKDRIGKIENKNLPSTDSLPLVVLDDNPSYRSQKEKNKEKEAVLKIKKTKAQKFDNPKHFKALKKRLKNNHHHP